MYFAKELISMTFRFTEARQKILTTVDKLGVVSTKQIIEFSGITAITVYKALERFEQLNLVKKADIPTKDNYFMITQTGSEWCGSINLAFRSSQKVPNMSILRHTLLVNDMILYYKKLFKEQKSEDIKIISERELLVEEIGKGRRSKKVVDTLPDFVFERSTGRKTAVEVELTRKRPDRLQKKLRAYKEQVNNGIYFNVAYCYDDPAVERLVRRYAEKVGISVILGDMNKDLGGE